MSADEIEQEQLPTEEATKVEEETTVPTEEVEPSEEGTGEETEPVEDLEQIRKDAKAFKDQKIRAEKAEKELKDLKAKGKDRVPNKDGQAHSDQDDRIARAEDRAERAELRAMGVTHADDIQYVREAAKRLGIEPAEAISDELVAAKLNRMAENRKSKDATPSPSKRGGNSGTNDVGRLADKVAAGGELPKDPALAEKVQKEISRRSQAAS